jgi:RNA polymerase sigma factor (sigma-70 family)
MKRMTPEQIIIEALDRYERPLISHAKEITGDLESARDAVQETFLRLSRQDVTALQPRLRPWLFLVCRNCALDHRRKVVRYTGEMPDEECASDEATPEVRAMATEEGSRLRTMVDDLPPSQREVVRLRFDSDLSYKEMAEVLEISVSHVGVQLHEALTTLRRQWNVNPPQKMQP